MRRVLSAGRARGVEAWESLVASSAPEASSTCTTWVWTPAARNAAEASSVVLSSFATCCASVVALSPALEVRICLSPNVNAASAMASATRAATTNVATTRTRKPRTRRGR